MKPKSSAPDSRGHWFIDCAECKRGGNGEKDCASGHTIKQIKRGGCFNGELLEKFRDGGTSNGTS